MKTEAAIVCYVKGDTLFSIAYIVVPNIVVVYIEGGVFMKRGKCVSQKPVKKQQQRLFGYTECESNPRVTRRLSTNIMELYQREKNDKRLFSRV